MGVRKDGRGTEEGRREGKRKDKEEWRRASNKERNEVIERKGMAGGKRRARGEIIISEGAIRVRGGKSLRSSKGRGPAALRRHRSRAFPRFIMRGNGST